jgi:GNAT superfamily N-acetyltransferase
VKHLWLTPAARGRGAGRRLLEELERRALELGAQELVLDTNASLEAAGGLYRSAGFIPIEAYNANPNATHWYGKLVAR